MASLPQFPNIDLSGLDAAKLSELDDKILAALRDAAYITIGFGVLAFQQVQVRRREVKAQFEEASAARRQQFEELARRIEQEFSSLDERLDRLEATLDSTVERLNGRLPEQAAQVVGQAHDIAKTARKQVRGLVKTSAA
jgi:DNA anti-recombination protein RmuC